MIKRVLTFISDVQESVWLDYISSNKVKILLEVKTCQNCLHHKNEKTRSFYILLYF